jgi:hypothetical protein
MRKFLEWVKPVAYAASSAALFELRLWISNEKQPQSSMERLFHPET